MSRGGRKAQLCLWVISRRVSFREMELPRGQPMNPVLTMNEDEIFYISLSDIEFVELIPSGNLLGSNWCSMAIMYFTLTCCKTRSYTQKRALQTVCHCLGPLFLPASSARTYMICQVLPPHNTNFSFQLCCHSLDLTY